MPALASTSELAAASQHGGGPGDVLLILIGLGALAAWAISLYVHPFTRCGRCSGTGVNKGSSGKRFGLCKACGGSRRKQRFGSKTLHRWVQSGSSEWRRQRALKAEQRVAERTRNPRNHGGK
jgi:hypothetical protein